MAMLNCQRVDPQFFVFRINQEDSSPSRCLPYRWCSRVIRVATCCHHDRSETYWNLMSVKATRLYLQQCGSKQTWNIMKPSLDCITHIFRKSQTQQTRHTASTFLHNFAQQTERPNRGNDRGPGGRCGMCRSKAAWEHFIFVPLPQSRVKTTSHLDLKSRNGEKSMRNLLQFAKRVAWKMGGTPKSRGWKPQCPCSNSHNSRRTSPRTPNCSVGNTSLMPIRIALKDCHSVGNTSLNDIKGS